MTDTTTNPKEGRGMDTDDGRRDPAALFARLEAAPLTSGEEPLGFERRLAHEQGWTLGHALAVVREYRRFLALAALARDPVCPSEDVDEAWHLHITRTADYARFCGEHLGRFLHHQPSRGGPAELERHRAMYERTLAAYRAAFGRPAPKPPAGACRRCCGTAIAWASW
jgi:hypothetical protein